MRARTRLSAVTTVIVATALVLTACSGTGGRRHHSSSSGGSDSMHDDSDGGDGSSGVHKDDTDDTDDLSTGGSGRRPSRPHRPNDRAIAAILPDLAALEGTPYGELEEDPVAENGDDASACEAFSRACEALRAHGEVLYAGSSSEKGVGFELYGYDSEPAARNALEVIDTEFSGYGFRPSSFAHYGEDGSSYTFGDDESVTLLVQGPYMGMVYGSLGDQQALAEALNEMFSERISQSLHGETPSAAVNTSAL
jgi:hypothetical protein